MGGYFLFVPCLISSLAVYSLASNNADVIHLDLSPLREKASSSNPPSGTEHSETATGEVLGIYCTGTTFPNDIFCDITILERGKEVGVRPFTTHVYLKFPHPTKNQVECFVSFWNNTEGTQSKLLYKSYSCYNLSDSTSDWLSNVEWMLKQGQVEALPDSTPPENLKVGDVKVLEIEDTSPENLALKCKRRLTRVQGAASVQTSPVAFDANVMACISTAPPPEPPTLPQVATET